MVKLELDWVNIPPKGYTYYGMDAMRAKKKYCVWYLYPIYGLGVWLYKKRLHLYHWLNDIGIMHTPKHCVMQLSDIWRYKK